MARASETVRLIQSVQSSMFTREFSEICRLGGISDEIDESVSVGEDVPFQAIVLELAMSVRRSQNKFSILHSKART